MHSRLGLPTFLTAAVVLSLSCRPPQSDALPPDLPGSYTYAGRGAIAGAPWDVRATLTLGADMAYRLLVRATLKREEEQETDQGTFRVAGEKLVLNSAGDSDTHELTIRGDSLLAGEGWGLTTRMAMRVAGVPKPVFLTEAPRPTAAQ